ncbi:hypothetical protein EJ05DRAFT_228756 [Pseudovirgaria hyperparasitica]|uniref:Uncharacterized protein n=1 Tax=Pseudovirgaria hyperparasitica TaxID=470096 RepID=A0A6A6VS14_9PEZI|nr:uncharacterized protein EJ05DRAFT_228756 [Pseudovirgaria hyperparasitica]KAF2752993.1 hypothetical protein EJ05DRAFT_228756 [Pseudovirgaria hyperparasitica]
MSGEAHKAFEYLKEKVPEWIENLEALRARVAEKHRHALRASTAPRKKKRTGSMDSLRPDENDAVSSIPTRIVLAPQPLSTTPLAPSTNNLTKRKRDAKSITSGHISGPPKYRMRQQMVVVYYDSEIQKSFETLVRNITTGRSMLRKGKMAAKMEALMYAMDVDDSTSGDNDEDPNAKIDIRSNLTGFRITRSIRAVPSPLRNAGSSSDDFDSADKDLETAQSLCERGAHQFLRDGDCSPELEGSEASFKKILALSEILVARQRAKE